MTDVLLITPPFVQPNTPYPAMPVIAGFLKSKGVSVATFDLSIEVLLRIFTQKIVQKAANKSQDAEFVKAGSNYATLVETAIRYLQGNAPELAYKLADLELYHMGNAFCELFPFEGADPYEILQESFGTEGVGEQAKFLASLFLDDLANHIQKALDEDFGFARYAENVAINATSLEPILEKLKAPKKLVAKITGEILREVLQKHTPKYVGITMPFPGTVFGGFLVASIVREVLPNAKIVLGGGYVNSELRELSDTRIFDYFDYISYDEGFAPWLGILGLSEMVRTRTRTHEPTFPNQCDGKAEVIIADYSTTDFTRYFSLAETPNTMANLWSNGKWLKVQLARGCYWHKCKFCDTALDYIGNYSAPDIATAVSALQTMAQETGICAFHFTDEAIPPKLLRTLSQEIIARKFICVWWGNIRFDGLIDDDLAILMRKSGCIAVTGGLECAHDRLLTLMNKGITRASARKVLTALKTAGILVHAYLMYGYPTETLQETKSALDFVRKLFRDGLLQSAFWHRFALTCHSPLAKSPPKNMQIFLPPPPPLGRFALNEISYTIQEETIDYDSLSHSLKTATYNFIRGYGLDENINIWF